MMDGNAGVGIGAATAPYQNLLESKLKLEAQLKGAAGWFFAIAGLSLVNSLIAAFEGNWHFFAGLGITTTFDVVAYQTHSSVAKIAAFVINIVIVCIPILFGVFAKKGHKWRS